MLRPAHILALGYLVIALNLGTIGGIEFASLVERGLLLTAALYFVVRRGAHWPVLGISAVVIAMILFLAAVTTYPSLNWATLIFSLNQIFIVYFFLAARYSRRDSFEILRIVAVMPVAIVAVGALYDTVGIWPMFGRGLTADWGRLQGSLIPAFLAGYALCGVVASMQLATAGNSPLYYGLALIDCMILLATGARAPNAIGLPLALAFMVLSPHVSVKAKIAGPAVALVVLAFVLIAIGQPLIARLSAGGTSGREEMWTYFEGLADQYYWTGIGFMQSYYSELPHELAVRINSTAVHNDYIRLSAELGTLGMIAFYVLLSAAFFYSAYRNAGLKSLFMNGLGFLGFLIYSWSDNAFGTPSDYMLMIVAVIAGNCFYPLRGKRHLFPKKAHCNRSLNRDERATARSWVRAVRPLQPCDAASGGAVTIGDKAVRPADK